MDELRGPSIQVVLHVKEGLGFGFLRTSFVVSGSLNGYMLETDPIAPSHAPVFDAELVWEAEKRRFRSLRVQNVPVKVEVFTMGSQGRKDKVGYLLLSLLGAQPCPSNKIVDVKHSWHRLLGVRSEGKCCHPQLLMSLSIEDRVNTPTPRNELRMFHSNEIAFPSHHSNANIPPAKSMLLTLNEYIAESKKTVSSPELQPQLLCDEGLIQIGVGRHLFVLSFVVGSVENIDVLLPEHGRSKDAVDCYVTYSVFTHNIMTDRVRTSTAGSGVGLSAHFNQRSSLRLASDLSTLARYFAECSYLVTRVCAGDKDIGICSMDLRKLIPTNDTRHFVEKFCNAENALTLQERCYILRCDDSSETRDSRRPYVDVEMTLRYLGLKENSQKPKLTARSVTHLESDRKAAPLEQPDTLEYKSGSCTNINRDVGGVAYTNMAARNTARYTNASGDAMLQTNDIAELIKKMCDSFTMSQEKLIAARIKPTTSDMQVQCQVDEECVTSEKENNIDSKLESEPVKLETSKSDTCITHKYNYFEKVRHVLPPSDRESIMQKVVDELEDWKEKQQEMFKSQLRQKEEYHLDLLAKEWSKKRVELECKLSRGIEQCRNLASDLSRATDDFRLRGYRNTEREKKLLEAKKALEAHYTAKYQELREASQKMEDDMNHQLKLKDMRIEELQLNVAQLEKQVDVLKNNIKNNEKEAESKYSGLTKDQTASLIQELRCLEEKLDSAVQSKAFFKEQWGRAVRDLHVLKLRCSKQMLQRLHCDRKELGRTGLETIEDQDENNHNPVDIKKLKDDFYVDILTNMPNLESHSGISTTGPEGLDIYDDITNMPKNPLNEKLNEMIAQRDRLIQNESPDEELLNHLNHEIRSMLLNCGN